MLPYFVDPLNIRYILNTEYKTVNSCSTQLQF